MVDKTFSTLQWLIERYQKVAITVLIIAFAFPFITTAVLWLDRSGYFNNVYQQEHEVIKDIGSMIENQIDEMWIQVKGGLDKQALQLEVNQDLIKDSVFYQQRTCVNTANTREEREICLQHAP